MNFDRRLRLRADAARALSEASAAVLSPLEDRSLEAAVCLTLVALVKLLKVEPDLPARAANLALEVFGRRGNPEP